MFLVIMTCIRAWYRSDATAPPRNPVAKRLLAAEGGAAFGDPAGGDVAGVAAKKR